MSFETTIFHKNISQFITDKSGNLIINAGPGSGKTTTIFQIIVPALISAGKITGQLMAFNKKNAMDFEAKIAAFPRIESGTIHSTCNKICRNNGFVKMKVESKGGYAKGFYKKATPGKLKEAAKELFPEEKEGTINNICRLVSLGKMNAIGIKREGGTISIDDREFWQEIKENYSVNTGGQSEDGEEFGDNEEIDLISAAIKLFKATVADKSCIDFDDMIYFVLYYNLPLPKWDFCILDEGQDITPITLEFLSRLYKQGTRIIVVGDKNQAINSFMGAMVNSIDEMSKILSAEILPLPVSYRCSKKAAELANSVFPNSVIANDNANEGSYDCINFQEFVAGIMNRDENDGILSRTHKNLIPFALQFIKAKREFIYKGITDLVTSMKKILWWNAKGTNDLFEIREKLTQYQQETEDKYNGKKMPAWVIKQGETIDSLNLLLVAVEMEGGIRKDVDIYLDKLLAAEKSNNGPTLATIHASKGMEWSNVYLVGNLVSPLAITPNELQAEECLKFVAYSRSSDRLISVPTE